MPQLKNQRLVERLFSKFDKINKIKMNKLIFNSTPWQEISISENSTNIKYSIWGFNFFNRSFLMGDVKKVDEVLRAIVITTNNGTFKFPVKDELRKKMIQFYKKEINFEYLIK